MGKILVLKLVRGSGFLTRIARAKELIAQGVPLGQIQEQVGYASRRAMDSAFTRYEGITPRAYDTQLHAVHSA